MEAILFALISYVCWGSGDIVGAVISKKIGGYSATFWSFFIRVLTFSIYLPTQIHYFARINILNLGSTIILSLIFIFGTALFLEAFKHGQASIIGTIGSCFVVVTVILSVIFLHERINISEVIGIGVIFVGLILTTLDLNDVRQKKVVLTRGIGLALISMISWGIYFAFVKVPVKEIGSFLPNYICYLFFPVILLIIKLENAKLQLPTTIKTWVQLVVFSFLGGIGNLSYNFGIAKGYTAIVAPIAGAYPTLLVFLAFFILKDRISKQQVVGIISALFGIVLLSLSSA